MDVIGYNSKGHITIIEVKASLADFKQDDKWDTYLNYCDEYYFLTDFSLPEGQKYHISEHMFKEKAKAGFLYGETDHQFNLVFPEHYLENIFLVINRLRPKFI
jgi:hypothetical protein